MKSCMGTEKILRQTNTFLCIPSWILIRALDAMIFWKVQIVRRYILKERHSEKLLLRRFNRLASIDKRDRSGYF